MRAAHRRRLDRRAAGLTCGGAVLWIADHDGELEAYALLVEGDVCRLTSEEDVEYVCSPRSCSCPAFAYSKRGAGCKHTRRCKELGLFPDLSRPAATLAAASSSAAQ